MKLLHTPGKSLLSLNLLVCAALGASSATASSTTTMPYDSLNFFDGKKINARNVEKYTRGDLLMGAASCSFVIDSNGEPIIPAHDHSGLVLNKGESIIECLHIAYGDIYDMTELYILDQSCPVAKPDVCVEGKVIAMRNVSTAYTDDIDAEAQLVIEKVYQVNVDALSVLDATRKPNSKHSAAAGIGTSQRVRTNLVTVTEHVITADEFGYRASFYDGMGNEVAEQIDHVYPAYYDAIPYTDSDSTSEDDGTGSSSESAAASEDTVCADVGASVTAAGNAVNDFTTEINMVTMQVIQAIFITRFTKGIALAGLATDESSEIIKIGLDKIASFQVGGFSMAGRMGAAGHGWMAETLCEMYKDELTEPEETPPAGDEIKIPDLTDTNGQQVLMCMVCSAYETVPVHPSQTTESPSDDDHTIVVWGNNGITENICVAFTWVPGESDSNGFCVD